MKLLMVFLIAGSVAVSDEISDLERDAIALELYMIDKVAHRDDCPELEWEQPPLDTYKETLVSHLPEECKNETN
jgi:hypothetical protein